MKKLVELAKNIPSIVWFLIFVTVIAEIGLSIIIKDDYIDAYNAIFTVGVLIMFVAPYILKSNESVSMPLAQWFLYTWAIQLMKIDVLYGTVLGICFGCLMVSLLAVLVVGLYRDKQPTDAKNEKKHMVIKIIIYIVFSIAAIIALVSLLLR